MARALQNLTIAILALFFAPNLIAQTSALAEVQTIARLYSASLDRPPRFDGLNFFVNSFESGRSIVGIANDFVESQEFTAKYGTLNDREYIEQLFRNVLGREGAEGGIEFWVGNLTDGNSRAFVLAQFADSTENISNTDALYGSMQFVDGRWEYNRLSLLAQPVCPDGICLQVQLNGPLGGSELVVSTLRDTGSSVATLITADEASLIAQLGSDTWENLSAFDRLSLLGTIALPTVESEQLYLLNATGGFDFDNDLNNLADAEPAAMQGTVHAIASGEQIASGLQLNTLTEAAYQAVIGSLNLLSDTQLLNRLELTASQLLSGDISGDSILAYRDVLIWQRPLHSDSLNADIADLNKLALAVGQGTDASDLAILSNRLLGGTAGLGLDETAAVALSPDGSCDGRGQTNNSQRRESITTLPPSASCGADDLGEVQSNQGNIAGTITPDERGIPASVEIGDAAVSFSDVTSGSEKISVEYTDSGGDVRRGSVDAESVPDANNVNSRYQAIATDDSASADDGNNPVSISTASAPRSLNRSKSEGAVAVSSEESDRFAETLSETMAYGALASNWSACVVQQFVAQLEARGETVESAVRAWAAAGCSSVLAETDTWVAERTRTQITSFRAAVAALAPVGCKDCFSFIANPANRVIVQVGEDPQFNGVAPRSAQRVRWTFGNGATATSRNPEFAYGEPGDFVARFGADYSDGSSGVDEVSVRVVPAQEGCFRPPRVRGTISLVDDPTGNTKRIVFNVSAKAFGENCQIEALDIRQIDGTPSVVLNFNVFDRGLYSFELPGVSATATLTFELRVVDSDGNTRTENVPVNLRPISA